MEKGGGSERMRSLKQKKCLDNSGKLQRLQQSEDIAKS